MGEHWWVWIAAGLAIGMLELLLPGYIFLGFAIGALMTGSLVFIGLLSASAPVAFAVFAVLSGLAWFAMRKLLGSQAGSVKTFTRDINDN